MRTVAMTLFVFVAASMGGIAIAQQAAAVSVPKRVSPALQPVKVYAGIPMVYKSTGCLASMSPEASLPGRPSAPAR
jgi:hypothetical protein